MNPEQKKITNSIDKKEIRLKDEEINKDNKNVKNKKSKSNFI